MDPENFRKITWDTLKQAIQAIQAGLHVPSTKEEELYQAVKNFCSSKTWAIVMHLNLRRLCNEHINSFAQQILLESRDNVSFLEQIIEFWQAHCQQMRMIQNIFLFIDITYDLKTHNLGSIKEMGLDLFRVNIVSNPDIRSRIVDSLLWLIQHERNGNTVDLVKSSMQMLFDLELYHALFPEEGFLSRFRDFCRV